MSEHLSRNKRVRSEEEKRLKSLIETLQIQTSTQKVSRFHKEGYITLFIPVLTQRTVKPKYNKKQKQRKNAERFWNNPNALHINYENTVRVYIAWMVSNLKLELFTNDEGRCKIAQEVRNRK